MYSILERKFLTTTDIAVGGKTEQENTKRNAGTQVQDDQDPTNCSRSKMGTQACKSYQPPPKVGRLCAAAPLCGSKPGVRADLLTETLDKITLVEKSLFVCLFVVKACTCGFI